MAIRRSLARALTRVTGYELRRVGAAGRGDAVSPLVGPVPDLPPVHRSDRLLKAPVFILCSIRSGSTLLRMILDSHSQIHAPHELHLRWVTVRLLDRYVRGAMTQLGSSEDELRFLLWDRILHRELRRHGKTVLVNKTPSDALMWRTIEQCWPDARFIFLLRDPAASAASWNRAHPELTADLAAEKVLGYVDAIEHARTEHGGLTVRYEDLTADPERETQRICRFLGLEWERAMLDYGEVEHGGFTRGLGDWGSRIRSGRVRPANPAPDSAAASPVLDDIRRAWGYLGTDPARGCGG